jgi:hypothetical protein
LSEQPEGLYALTSIQQDFVFCKDEVSAFYGGIGNGKTLAACLRVLMLSDMYPGNRILVGRLTYPELRDTTQKQLIEIVQKRNGGTLEPGPYVQSYNKNDGLLVLRNGSEILFRYLENEQSILSLNLGAFYVDQAEFVKEEIFTHLLGRLRLWGQESVKEFKRKYRRTPRHFAFITGNPAPGWVYRRFKLKRTDDAKPLDYTLFEAPTSSNAANLPPNYIEGLRASYPETWVQRYLEGSWETFQGQVWTELDRKLHGIKPFFVPLHWPRYSGWDHGTTNPTSVSFLAVDEWGNVVLYKLYYQISNDLRQHANSIIQMCEGDSVRRGEDGKSIITWMDPSIKGESNGEGRDFRQLYMDYGIFGIPANNAVAAGLGKISMYMHPDPNHEFPPWHPRGEKKDAKGKVIQKAELGSPRFFIFDTLDAWWHEAELYHYKPRRMGEMANSYEEPVKYLDHAQDSTRYGFMAALEQAEPLNKPREAMKRPSSDYMAAAYSKLLSMDR